jgi:hypothetical protein
MFFFLKEKNEGRKRRNINKGRRQKINKKCGKNKF